MAENHFKIIQVEIAKDLDYLKQLSQECIEFYEKNKESVNQTSTLRVLGSILHDFYTCIEKIFKKISITIDDDLPSDPEWHSTLLNRMSLDIPSIRKKVIDEKLKEILYDYLRFRHIFRNIYGFKFNWEKISHLVESIKKTYTTFDTQMNNFFNFLNSLGEE